MIKNIDYNVLTSGAINTLNEIHEYGCSIQEMLNNGEITPLDLFKFTEKGKENSHYIIDVELDNSIVTFFFLEKNLMFTDSKYRNSFIFVVSPDKITLSILMNGDNGCEKINIKSWDELTLERNESSDDKYEFSMYQSSEKIGVIHQLNHFILHLMNLIARISEFVDNKNTQI